MAHLPLAAFALLLSPLPAGAYTCITGCEPAKVVTGWAEELEDAVLASPLECPRDSSALLQSRTPNDPYRPEYCERKRSGSKRPSSTEMGQAFVETLQSHPDAAGRLRAKKAFAELLAFHDIVAEAFAEVDKQSRVPWSVFSTLGGTYGADPYKAPPAALKRCLLVRKTLAAARARVEAVTARTLQSYVPDFKKKILQRMKEEIKAVEGEVVKVEELARVAAALAAGRDRKAFEASLGGRGIVDIYAAAKTGTLSTLKNLAAADAQRLAKAFDGTGERPALSQDKVVPRAVDPETIPAETSARLQTLALSPAERARAEESARANIKLINERCRAIDAGIDAELAAKRLSSAEADREKTELREIWALALEKQYLDLKALGGFTWSDRTQSILADARVLDASVTGHLKAHPEELGLAVLTLAVKNPIVSELLFPGPLYAASPNVRLTILQKLKYAVSAGTVADELKAALKLKAARAENTLASLQAEVSTLGKRYGQPSQWPKEKTALIGALKRAHDQQKHFAEVLEILKKPSAAAVREPWVGEKARAMIDQVSLKGAKTAEELDFMVRNVSSVGQNGVLRTPAELLGDYVASAARADPAVLNDKNILYMLRSMSTPQRVQVLSHLEAAAAVATVQGAADQAKRLRAIQALLAQPKK